MELTVYNITNLETMELAMAGKFGTIAVMKNGHLDYATLEDVVGKKKEMCMIGDQIVTDVLAGNRFKIMTILVDPLGEKDLKITGLNRKIEEGKNLSPAFDSIPELIDSLHA